MQNYLLTCFSENNFISKALLKDTRLRKQIIFNLTRQRKVSAFIVKMSYVMDERRSYNNWIQNARNKPVNIMRNKCKHILNVDKKYLRIHHLSTLTSIGWTTKHTTKVPCLLQSLRTFDLELIKLESYLHFVLVRTRTLHCSCTATRT